MSEQDAPEFYFPCLLDRLRDDAPEKKKEGRAERAVSLKQYKQGVRRDLEWLFNARAHISQEDVLLVPFSRPERARRSLNISKFPLVERSVLNYGARQLCGLIAPDMDQLQTQMNRVIETYEPRILGHSLSFVASMNRQLLAFMLSAELWAGEVPEQLRIKTELDLELGPCTLVGDSAITPVSSPDAPA